MQWISVVSIAQFAVNAEWTFSWPYTKNGACHCEEISPPALEAYTSQNACLNAFASNDYEYCSHNGHGVNEDQCSNAASISEGLNNGDCASLCTSLVAGVIPLEEFEEFCRFVMPVPFGPHALSVSSESCYSNYVYGWSDFDSHNPSQTSPLRVFAEVPTASKCQELCQDVPTCAFFSWKGALESKAGNSGFQNKIHTCLLYTAEFQNKVLEVNLKATLASDAYCDLSEVTECLAKPWESGFVNIFNKYNCLTCGCETKCAWKSATHITGPAFCLPASTEAKCEFYRPTWTTTPAPCVVRSDRDTFKNAFMSLWDETTQEAEMEMGTPDWSTTTESAQTETSVFLETTSTTIQLEQLTTIELDTQN